MRTWFELDAQQVIDAIPARNHGRSAAVPYVVIAATRTRKSGGVLMFRRAEKAAPATTPATAPAPAPAPAPARPARTRRVCAWALDFAVVVTLAVLLGWLTFERISAELTSMTSLAGTGVWEVVTSDGDLVGAGQGAGESLWRSAVNAVWQAFAALVVLTFAYHLVSLAAMGRTPGHALTALRVVPRGVGEGRPGWSRAATRAAVVTLADVGWYALACCLLVGGAFGASVLCWIVAVAFFALNATLALVGSRRSLADWLAGTTVTGAWHVRATLTRIGDAVRRRRTTDEPDEPDEAPSEAVTPA
jgi:RDD family protein